MKFFHMVDSHMLHHTNTVIKTKMLQFGDVYPTVVSGKTNPQTSTDLCKKLFKEVT